MDPKLVISGLFVISAVICGLTHADEIRCFVCSSYMEQCKEHVHSNQGYAHRGRCYGKCFVRLGEDKALYRGCFDAFREVPYLTSDYTGCKNQTWNGQSLPWCFCEGDLCNKVSMEDLGYKNQLDLSEGYRVNGHDEGMYPTEYGTAHYVDEMDKYDEIPGENIVYQQSKSEGYNQREQQKHNGYSDNGQQTGHDNNYAKEGYEVDGYEIKDVNHAAIDLAEMNKLDKYMQDYYTENNAYQTGDYGQDYNKFHYYQVEDPNAYIEDIDTQKYIDMDESEGIKLDASHIENQLVEDIKKPEPKESAEDTGENEVYEEQNNQQDVLPNKDESVNSGIYNEGYNGRYAQQQSSGQSRQLYQPHATNQRRNYFDRQPSNNLLRDDFKYQGQTEVEEKEEEEDPYFFPPHLAERIECAKTGFYQNPDDCRTFVACILDPNVRRPYMHLMRCPEGLVWDNSDKICNQYSTTCNVGGVMEGTYEIEDLDVKPVEEKERANSQQLKDDFIKYAGEQ